MNPIEVLNKARIRFSQLEIAEFLGKDSRTIRRWEKGEIITPSTVIPMLQRMMEGTGGNTKITNFDFIDLFAGIGGIRLGFEAIGGNCVFTSEWNNRSNKTYAENFGEKHSINGDITKIDASTIPNHDVLLGGFPCQPFSIAGISKKNALGRPHGFECTTQGTLFFDVARIIAEKRPSAFLLENVKNLISHNKGDTFRVIINTLRDELGYDIHWKIIDGQSWVPQHRERIIIVGFREKTDFCFDNLVLPTKKTFLKDILHPENGTEKRIEHDGERFISGTKGKVQSKFNLSERLWVYLQNYAKKHKEKGNGFGFGLVTPDMTSRTLSARYYKDGSEILVSRGNGKTPRRLTPRECARLMGFPDTFKIPVSDTQAYKQFGNSVVVPVISVVAKLMEPHILKITQKKYIKESAFLKMQK